LLVGSIAFDFAFLATHLSRFSDISWWFLGGALISGIAAAPFGSLDWLGLPRKGRPKNVGFVHGILAFLSAVFLAASWGVRYNAPDFVIECGVVISLVGIGCLMVAAWLGGDVMAALEIKRWVASPTNGQLATSRRLGSSIATRRTFRSADHSPSSRSVGSIQ